MIVSFGALNRDLIYAVPHIVTPGETLTATELSHASGGKGLNQASALAKAGSQTLMAGAVGADGQDLLDELRSYGVDLSGVHISEHPTGHALIQVDAGGENCIILFGGANHHIEPEWIDEVVQRLGPDDLVVMQNEIRPLAAVWQAVADHGVPIAFNPSPFDDQISTIPLEQARFLFVNHGEAQAVMASLGLDENASPEQILDALTERWPHIHLILTLGSQGAMYAHGDERVRQQALSTSVVDTTGAGDTFTGFFLSAFERGMSAAESLRIAAQASAIAVSRHGAAVSIPTWDEVMEALG